MEPCTFAKHLKARRWRGYFQSICDVWKADPSVFKTNPHPVLGLNTWI